VRQDTPPASVQGQDGKFVIDPAAEEAKVRATVAACPSHALKIAG